jgi:hypothetical protein
MPGLVVKLNAFANHCKTGMKFIDPYGFTSESSIFGGGGSYVTSS